MRKDKEIVFNLRRNGESYRKIQQKTGISRGTLSVWLKNESWSNHQIIENSNKNRSKEHLSIMRDIRRGKLDQKYQEVEKDAILKYQTYKNEPLFWAGIMAYASDGDKSTRGIIRITNREFYFHKVFIKFCQRYLNANMEDIKCGLIITSDLNESLCREMWSNLLGIKRDNFHKTQVIQGKDKLKRLQYGIGMSIISNTAHKKKLSKWLQLAQDEKFEAAIV